MSDQERREREVVLPEPEGRPRRLLPILGSIWVVLMLVIPLRYYLSDDPYDERFAWRMFSAVRVQRCRVGVVEETAGGARPLALMEVLPAPWTALLERNRPAVVEAFLRWRCDQRDATERVRFHNECVDAGGDPVPSIDRAIECNSGEITTASSEAGE